MLTNQANFSHSKNNTAYFKTLKCFVDLLKLSSTACAVTGGILLAANTSISKFGFILLACSSGQLLLASLITRDRITTLYASSLFIFVDCLGIYRWLLT